MIAVFALVSFACFLVIHAFKVEFEVRNGIFISGSMRTDRFTVIFIPLLELWLVLSQN